VFVDAIHDYLNTWFDFKVWGSLLRTWRNDCFSRRGRSCGSKSRLPPHLESLSIRSCGAIARIWQYFSENDPRTFVVVAHFTSELTGGAGIAAQRLHSALCKAGVNSRLYFGEGQPLDATMIPAFQNRTFFWRNAAILANRWRRYREAKVGS
jgi:hypothetical protein